MTEILAVPLDRPEKIVRLDDIDRRLSGAIVLHSTRLGPAAGGCRFSRYGDDVALVTDALRLAEGMTFKNALADLPFGGGKAVIQAPEGDYDRIALFEAFGEAIDQLEGGYVTAEDVGTSVWDMDAVARTTRFVAGRKPQAGCAGGDPSPWTAEGVFLSICHLVEAQLGIPLKNATIAVQGLGNVGMSLCWRLWETGARLIVSDVSKARVEIARASMDVTVVPPDQIMTVRADVFAPCAMGGILNDVSIPHLAAQLVCGGANNQLATADDAVRLADRGIAYAPDYIVNAGGIICVAGEYLGWSEEEVAARTRQIPDRLRHIFHIAEGLSITPAVAARRLAMSILEGGARTGGTGWI